MYFMIYQILAEILWKSESIKPSQDAKRRVLSKYNLLGTKEDQIITKHFYEIMRRQGVIDRIIEHYLGHHPIILDPWLRASLREFIYFLYFTKINKDRLTKIKRELAKWLISNTHPGTVIQFNKIAEYFIENKDVVLKKFSEFEIKYLVPEWYANKIISMIGKHEGERLFKYFLKVPKISIRVNTLKTNPEELKKILETKYNKKVSFGKYTKVVLKFSGPFDFDKSEEFRNGYFIVQEEAAALASIFLDPKPGQTIVDLTAAPGGKTEHIAELMKLEGKIFAFDIDEERIKRMRDLLKRTGTDKIVKIYKKDARLAPEILGEEVADKVLLDAPCTSDGTLHKNPELRWRISEKKVYELQKLQRELLDAAAKLVKPGGEILYCTCTLLKEENEDNVIWFLNKYKNFELVSLPDNIGTSGYVSGTIRMWPHKEDTIGFFYAKFRKNKE